MTTSLCVVLVNVNMKFSEHWTLTFTDRIFIRWKHTLSESSWKFHSSSSSQSSETICSAPFIEQESCAIAKMTAQCAVWVPWTFSGLLIRPWHYSQHFHGLLFRSTLWMLLHNLKSVALPVPEIIGGTQKIWAVPGYAHAPYSPKLLMGFYSDKPCKYTRQIWSS